MSAWLAYFAGVVTPFALAGFGYLAFKLIAHDGMYRKECIADDFMTTTERPIVRWIKWTWHRNTVGRKAWHREAVAEYRRKWRLDD